MQPKQKKSELPPSPTRLWINGIGVGLAMLVFIGLERFPQLPILFIAMACVVTLALSIAGLEMLTLRTYRWPSTGLDFRRGRARDWRAIGVRLVGFFGTILILAGGYWLLEEYHQLKYLLYFQMLAYAVPFMCLGGVFYFIWLDPYLVEPQDGYWHMGTFLLGRWRQADKGKVGQLFLAWLVKAFFLPLMLLGLASQSKYFLENGIRFQNAAQVYTLCFHLIFGWDLLLSATGYIFSLRLFDSHVRSTEPTLVGWVAALLCYEPFVDLTLGHYFQYDNDWYWNIWLQDHPVLFCIWGSVILGLYGIYVLATLCFGIRFSNLTHRGILSNGPYRFCKHPAYISKNLAWWLVSIPFISGDTSFESIRYCILLVGLNVIYFIRARTEERHLSRDSVYVQYALAMNERSLFAGLGRLVPFFRYRPPASTPEAESQPGPTA